MGLIKPLKIGKVTLKNNLTLAPLAGYTDIAFRKICLELGAGLTTTEMVSVRGLLHESNKTADLLKLDALENLSCVQFFGSNPNDFLEVAKRGLLENFDLIDINMGCPMPKITKNGDGSALLDNQEAASSIVKALVSQKKTVTVKVRLGKKDKHNALNYCLNMQDAGASLITVHGRTAKQLYSGQADWDAIGEIANKLAVPVIGNGDIIDAQDVLDKIKTYKVSGVMIGRGAIARPDIFARAVALDSRVDLPKNHPTLKEIMLRHVRYTLEHFNPQFTIHKLRKHFAYYLKGIKDIKDLKIQLITADCPNKMIDYIENANLNL